MQNKHSEGAHTERVQSGGSFGIYQTQSTRYNEQAMNQQHSTEKLSICVGRVNVNLTENKKSSLWKKIHGWHFINSTKSVYGNCGVTREIKRVSNDYVN